MTDNPCNPILDYGPDPFATFHDGWYYVLVSEHVQVGLRRTRDLRHLSNAEHRVVYSPGADPRCVRDLWAPEIHRIAGRWHIYFAATIAGVDEGVVDRARRLFVLACEGDDPFADTWRYLGPLRLPESRYAIDATVIHDGDIDYCVWSSKRDLRGGWWQHLMISRLVTPVELDGREVVISQPELEWECDLQPTNEGPQVLYHGDDIWLAYSASAFWSPCYCLGFLCAKRGSDLLDPFSWTKLSQPFFSQSRANGVYGPGHNSFVTSPDGSEDWILYHARRVPRDGFGDSRSTRMQRFGWDEAGLPLLGEPVAVDVAIPCPSGTADLAGCSGLP